MVDLPVIVLSGLRKSFEAVEAVAGIDLEIADGEFLTLLGPSGSGKTTVLRMIAGFEAPTAGTIALKGRDVTALPPYERDVNTVFQDYALFPHMTVAQNLEYGLKVRGVRRAGRRDRVRDALAVVRLQGYGDRRPHQLSGGQRQRVALARAIVNEPQVMLLDEPLGALDRQLREQMQVEIKDLQRRLGYTFVFVTHDQDEAMTMSDRIAVFEGGRIVQVGTPEEVYERPANAFVAGFVGTSNLVTGDLARTLMGRDGAFAVRPEKVLISEEGWPGTVAEVIYAGPVTRYVVDLEAGARMVVVEPTHGEPSARRGEAVRLGWHEQHVIEIPTAKEDEDAL